MMKLFKFLSRTSMATLGNSLLGFIAASMALCGIALTALYLIKFVDRNSPEMIDLQCAIGISRPECIDYQKELDDLAKERAALATELEQLQRKLKNLALIEKNVDSVTLFRTIKIPDSKISVIVGTEYRRLLEPELDPTHYCYIDLPNVKGVDQHLHIRNYSGDIRLSATVLRNNGISQSQLTFAKSVCKPYLIAAGQ